PGEHLRPTHRPRPRQGPLPHPRRALHRRQTCGQPPHRAPGRVHRNHLAPTRSPRLTPRQPTTTTVTGCHHTPETITQRAPAECLHLYEYMLSKIATAGQNGQFRTPRHIIQLMVEMMAPQPGDEICDPACGTAGFLVGSAEYVERTHREALFEPAQRQHF